METTSEEDVLLGTVVGEESFVISPVVVGDNSTSRVNRGSQEDGDKTLVENTIIKTSCILPIHLKFSSPIIQPVISFLSHFRCLLPYSSF